MTDELPENLKLGIFELIKCTFNEPSDRYSIKIQGVHYACSIVTLMWNCARPYSTDKSILNMLSEFNKTEFIFDYLTNKINPEDVVLSRNV